MNYKISKQAEIDFENIWLYTFEEWSIDQADYYFDLIMDEIEYISKNPKSGKDYNEISKFLNKKELSTHLKNTTDSEPLALAKVLAED